MPHLQTADIIVTVILGIITLVLATLTLREGKLRSGSK